MTWCRISSPRPRMLRPATEPGEDRNDEADIIRAEGEPDPRPATGRGSQHPHPDPTPRCGAELRPATEPGEDRNLQRSLDREPCRSRAAPGHRAGRGSQLCLARRRDDPTGRLRPATEPGEDRNYAWPGAVTIPRAGCARPPSRTRIATPTSWSMVGPPRKLRPATEPGEDRNRSVSSSLVAASVAAAPGHRAGRGSQLRRHGQWWGRLASCAPATEPGEDRNQDRVHTYNV